MTNLSISWSWMFNLAQQGHDTLLQHCPACGEYCAGVGKLSIHIVVGQDLGDRQLISTAADLCLLTEQPEAGHCCEHSLYVYAPQVHEEHNLQHTSWSEKSIS